MLSLGLVLTLILMSSQAVAAMYACPQPGGREIYTERPLQPDQCRKIEVEPAQPTTQMQDLSGTRQFGQWSEASGDTMAEVCKLYREWIALSQKGHSIERGITPPELLRRHALDPIFAGRPGPNCEGR